MLGFGLLQYTEDYDEKYPPTSTQGYRYGWADSLIPYLYGTQFFECPAVNNKGQTNPQLKGYSDYYLNVNLAQTRSAALKNPLMTIIIGEGNDGTDNTDARYAKSKIPPAWFGDTNSPLYRHNDKANYLFADGHVKLIAPANLQAELGKKQLIY